MKKNKFILTLIAIISICFMACEPQLMDKPEIGAPPSDTDISFTISPGADANHWVLTNTSLVNGIAKWDLGNGVNIDGDEVIAFYPDIDNYTITLTLITKSGYLIKSIEHTQDVADPLYGNLVMGGKFETADDIANWTIQYPDLGNQGLVTFVDGRVHFDNNPWSWGQATIYQPIEVVAGQEYRVDLNFETAGVTNGWFKVYACLTEPVQGAEYTGEILVTEIPIWGDWAVQGDPLSGRLINIHNPDSGNKNNCVVSFATTGTIWLEIQCGAQELNDGVYVDNVEFRAYFGDN